MKNLRLNIILLLAIIFGVMAAFAVYKYLNNVKAAYVKQGNFVEVAVAAQYIPPKTQLNPQMFTMQEIPSKYVNDDAEVDPQALTGKLAKTPIFKGEQILRSKMAGDNDASEGLAFIIPEGQRAMTVAVNEVSGIAGLIKPGDRVDVLVTFDANDQTMTSLILQNVKVLATDKQMEALVDQASQGKIYQTVTMQVTPQQAQPLALASEQGSIRLMMRSPADQGVANIPSAKMNGLVR